MRSSKPDSALLWMRKKLEQEKNNLEHERNEIKFKQKMLSIDLEEFTNHTLLIDQLEKTLEMMEATS